MYLPLVRYQKKFLSYKIDDLYVGIYFMHMWYFLEA